MRTSQLLNYALRRKRHADTQGCRRRSVIHRIPICRRERPPTRWRHAPAKAIVMLEES